MKIMTSVFCKHPNFDSTNRFCNKNWGYRRFGNKNCLKHGHHAYGTRQIKMRNQIDMAYLEFKIVDDVCMNHQKRILLLPFFINILLIEAKLFPQSP